MTLAKVKAHPQQNENGSQQQIFHSAQSVGPVNQARPLTRIDSRSSLQFRPPFPNQPDRLQFANLSPNSNPSSLYRGARYPVSVRQDPKVLCRNPPFPQNQNRANFRPPAPFPRTPVPNQRPPGLLHQKSVPAFPIIRPQIPEEGANRSQTLDTTEIEYSKGPDDNKDANEHTKTSSGAAINNRSYSLNMNPPESPNESADDQRRRSASNVYGLREGRPSSVQSSHSDSVESLDKKQENEVPSRPESRSASRMNKIVEDEGKHRNSLTNESHKSPDMSNESPGEKSQPTVSDTPDSTNSNNVQSEPQAVVIQPPSPKSPIPKPAHKSPTPKPSSHGNAPIQNGTEKITSENTRQNATKPSENIKEGPKKPDKLLNLDKPTKAKSPARSEGDNDSGVDESTQGNDPSSNGENRSPRKASKSRNSSTTPTGRSLSRGSKSPSLKSPDSNVTTPGSASEKKKVPMNKVQVGSAPSPNLKVVRSKIGSLENASYKPGGGKVKIETKKLDFKTAGPRIEAKNDKYIPKGGEKKIVQQKLQWNAKSKIGSLENTTYKPKGGDKKIETVKLDFKEKAKPKVGSKDNIKHQPGGGDIKIENKKLDVKANSKIGSLDNVKYKPGGGEKKIFDDKDYLKQKSAVSSIDHSLSGSQNSLPSQPDTKAPVADENLNQEH
ncbi:hypothetical protein NQ318_000426 [Aromia moschata]|uniref:Microtubule-associated protein n=1 Tax=Aromia moschata TaxID=1265417 RepID=A0AAV8YVI5_9CUCU|nr:hypothetical protein NQ318_000426 [Aromia moschata]